jgi:hypothetical protein
MAQKIDKRVFAGRGRRAFRSHAIAYARSPHAAHRAVPQQRRQETCMRGQPEALTWLPLARHRNSSPDQCQDHARLALVRRTTRR